MAGHELRLRLNSRQWEAIWGLYNQYIYLSRYIFNLYLMEALAWSFGVLVILIGVVANYTQIVDFWKRWSSEQDSQPKLAISTEFGHSGITNASDHIYIPFKMEPGEAMTFEQREQCSFDYNFHWTFRIDITNQKEGNAYRVKLLPVDETSVVLHIHQKIDPTKPFKSSDTKSYDVTCRRTLRCTPAQAKEVIKGYPIQKLRFEYENIDGIKFATEFFPNEMDDDKRNLYSKA